MTVPVVRKRVKKPKTRTGCLTCRARRIKCDEGTPSCRRCLKSGRQCEGYEESVTQQRCRYNHDVDSCNKSDSHTSGEVEYVTGRRPKILPRTGLFRRPALVPIVLNGIESHAFDFFRIHTLQHLPGTSLEWSWEQIALRMCHHEPAVMLAATALGSAHRAILWNRSSTNQDDDPLRAADHHFALTQYNNAIVAARTYLQRLGKRPCPADKVDMMLILSLLFFTFEAFHGHDEQAAMHLQTGIRVLLQKSQAKAPVNGECPTDLVVRATPRTNLDALTQTLVRLDGDLCTFNCDYPSLNPICLEPMPISFSFLDEANLYLDVLTSRFGTFIDKATEIALCEINTRSDINRLGEDSLWGLSEARSRGIKITPELQTSLVDLRRDIRAWMSAFAFISLTDENRPEHVLTQIYCFWVWVIIETARDVTEMLVDRFEEQFDHITGLMEKHIAMQCTKMVYRTVTGRQLDAGSRIAQSLTHTTTPPAFAFGTGMVSTVMLIVAKCRDSDIRRRCIRVLRDMNMQGVYDTGFMASYLQTLVEVEEGRARAMTGHIGDFRCHDVPEEARLLYAERMDVTASPDATNYHYRNHVGRMTYVVWSNGAGSRLDAVEMGFRVDRNDLGCPLPPPSDPQLQQLLHPYGLDVMMINPTNHLKSSIIPVR